MKRQLILVLLLFLPLIVSAQKEGQGLIDSILKILPAIKEDSTKVKLESRITFEYAYINPDLGIKYGLDALALAKRLKYDRGLENLYNALGAIYFQKSDFPKGMEYFLLCLKISEEKGNKKDIQLRAYNISSAYFNIKDYGKALEYSERSLKIAEELKDTTLIAANLSNMGAIYGDQKDEVKGLEYLFRALKMLERRDDIQTTAATLQHICATYVDLKNYPLALEYGKRSLAIFVALGDSVSMGTSFTDLGSAYFGMAVDSSGKNAQNFKGGYNDKYLQQAIRYMQQSREIYIQNQTLDGLFEVDRHLSEMYELGGNYKDALITHKEYVTLKDSVYSSDNKIKIANLETQREQQLKDKQIKINKLEKVFFTVGAGLLLVVITVVARNFMIQKKANKVKEELLRQKDVLMKEIHHRVKNNLQVISALLDLQLTNISDEYARSAMSESNTRIRSISLIHQQLYQNENINTIEFSKFAKDLMHQVTTIFSKTGQKIILKSNMSETLLDIDTAVPLGLILNELMTNSFKYAFVNVAEGYIEISLKQNGHYELVYSDSGPGLPAGMDISSFKGLGMRLIRSLSKQIGGEFVYKEKDKDFVITFKDISGRKMTD